MAMSFLFYTTENQAPHMKPRGLHILFPKMWLHREFVEVMGYASMLLLYFLESLLHNRKNSDIYQLHTNFAIWHISIIFCILQLNLPSPVNSASLPISLKPLKS